MRPLSRAGRPVQADDPSQALFMIIIVIDSTFHPVKILCLSRSAVVIYVFAKGAGVRR